MFLLLCAPIPFDFECFCLCMPQVAFDCLWKCILHMVCGCFGLCWCHAFFHFDFRKARFGWLVLVCVWGCVCCGGPPFCMFFPHGFGKVSWEMPVVGGFRFFFFHAWVPLADSPWKPHLPSPMCNMHWFYRCGPWCSSPKLPQRLSPPNLACTTPLPKERKSSLSIAWGGCLRIGIV